MTPTEYKLLQVGLMILLLITIALVIKYIPRGDEKDNKVEDDNMDY